MITERYISQSRVACGRDRAHPPRLLAVLGSIVLILGLFQSAASAQAESPQDLEAGVIDSVARQAMAAFDVPGMAVGVVKDGKTVFARGYGIRELGRPEPVDMQTMFRVASVSKAFTTAAIAILVDEGKVAWADPVIDHLPEFRMNDPWVTANLGITDLLAHRGGLAPHAGDLMLWPVPNTYTRADIINALRYFPLERGFRAGYSYDNVMYIVAGEIVARATGGTWGEFVDQRIMQPLAMERCFAGSIPPDEMHNLAAPHGEDDGKMVIIERNRVPAEPSKFAPAGGVVCSLGDLITWVRTQLGQGTSPAGVALFDAAQSRKMWSPHNWLGVGERTYELHGTHFRAYGLGWRLRDVHGYREVSHTGSLDGMRAHVLMIPELALGAVVLTNGSSSAARDAVMYTIEQAYLPVEKRDWVQTYLKLEQEDRDRAGAEVSAPDKPQEFIRASALPVSAYTGVYRDPWFGDVSITEQDGVLHFAAGKSPRLSGAADHHSGDTFLVRWTDRTLAMDAYIHFETDLEGKVTALSMTRSTEYEQSGPDHFKYLNLIRVE